MSRIYQYLLEQAKHQRNLSANPVVVIDMFAGKSRLELLERLAERVSASRKY